MVAHVTSGEPAWQYLFLGRRPELVIHLPLERFPVMPGSACAGSMRT